jgi:hypothetical protein
MGATEKSDPHTSSDIGRIVTRLKNISASTVYLILLWVAVALAGSWGVTWGWGYLSAADRHREVLSFSLGLLNVVVLGSIAALLLENFKSGQTQALRTIERQREISHTAREAYDLVKKVRRLVQDRTEPTPGWQQSESKRTLLAKLGAKLIDGQLKFEHLKEQTEHATDLPHFAEASARFKKLEHEANKVSDALRKVGTEVTNKDVETIRQFVTKADFKPAFSWPYHEAIAILNGTCPRNASDHQK